MEITLNRIPALDALRGFTMYLGVILHSSIAYKAGFHPRYWIRDPEASNYFFDHLYFWIHSFRMPLFFLLSGFFTVLLYNKIGESEFIKNRARRILVPFAVCIIIILPFSVAPFTFSRLYFDQGLSFSDTMNRVWDEVWKLMTLQKFKGFQHFWFLLNLIYFYSGFIILQHLKVDFKKIAHRIRLSNFNFLVLASIGTYIIMLLYWNDWSPSIWTGLFPRNPQLLYYGFYYAIGIYIYFNVHYFDFFKKYFFWLLSIGTVISVINVYIQNFVADVTQPGEIIYLFKALLAVQNVILGFGMIGFCLRYLNFKSDAIRYSSDAAYWVYIVHLFFVATLQIACIVLDVNTGFRFLLTLGISSIISYSTYHLIRYTIIGYYLHGTRTRT